MNNHDLTDSIKGEFSSLSAKLLVFGCLMAQVLGNGMTTIYGVFVNPVAEEFSANMSTMSLGMVLFLLFCALTSALLGTLLKPGNIKPYMLWGCLLLAFGFVCLSRSSSLSMIAASIIIISIAISMYTMMPGSILIAQRFNKFRGRALAISVMGISFAGFFLPPISAAMLEIMGWRDAVAIIGISSAILLFVTFYFCIEDKPTAILTNRQSDNVDENLIDAKVLINDKRFWSITFIFSLFYSCSLIMAVHSIPYFLTLGLSIQEAAWIIVLGSVSGLAGKIIYGALVDWLPDHFLLLLASLQLLPCGLWYLQGNIIDYSSLIYPVVITLMFFTGGTLPMQPYINSRVFGAASVSKSTGFQSALALPISLVATPLAGFIFDTQGNYQWVFYGCGLAMLISLIPTYTLIIQQQNR